MRPALESSSVLPAHEESLAHVVEDIAEDDPRKINNFELRDLLTPHNYQR